MAQTITSKHYKGDVSPLEYYIASKTSATPNIDVTEDVRDHDILIFTDRSYCSCAGDYYLKADSSGKSILYRYNKPNQDLNYGDFLGWVSKNFIELSSSCYTTEPTALKQNLVNGVWNNSLKKLFYRYMMNNTEHNFSVHRDLLGYIDKDVEKYFVSLEKDEKTGKVVKKTMLNFDTWEDLE